jgi:hypothetical protein
MILCHRQARVCAGIAPISAPLPLAPTVEPLLLPKKPGQGIMLFLDTFYPYGY